MAWYYDKGVEKEEKLSGWVGAERLAVPFCMFLVSAELQSVVVFPFLFPNL